MAHQDWSVAQLPKVLLEAKKVYILFANESETREERGGQTIEVASIVSEEMRSHIICWR